MKINYKTLEIILETAIARAETKLDRAIHKPFSSRMLLFSPTEFISKLNNQGNPDKSEVLIESFLNSIHSRGVVDQIDYEMQKNLPIPKFQVGTIRNLEYFNEWNSILESIYIIVRLLKPNLVVETGVGVIGMSSTYLLAALEDNNYGHLYSIDPDKIYSLYGYHVGSGIPEDLRKRHTLVNDYSQNSLEPLLKRIGQIDVFLHDGDHRFKTKLFEYETAYKYLKSGGVIMSDDTWDSAFDLFVSKYKNEGYSVKYGKDDFFSFTCIQE